MDNAAPVMEAAPPTEPSPAHTPLIPPAGTEEDGTVAVPPATPKTEKVPLPPAPFAEELPPDFWGDALEPPGTLQAAPEARFKPITEAVYQPASAPTTTKPLEGKLTGDPRFILLTELFPGRISNWQSAETPPSAAAEGADDAPEVPETVDLEAGLDLDEAEDDAEDDTD